MFLVFEQDTDEGKPQQIRVGFDEWGNIQEAVQTLLDQKLVK